MAGGCPKIELFELTRKCCLRIANHSLNWLILCCLVLLFVSSAAYLWFEAKSMIEYAMVFCICSAIVLCIIVDVMLLWKTENLLEYIESCEQFIAKRTHSTHVYRITNGKISKFSELWLYAMVATNLINMLLPLTYTAVNYYILDLGEESFFSFYLTWWPFNWKTPSGYLMAWLAEFGGSAALTVTTIPSFNIFVGSNWLFMVIAADITNDMISFNSAVKLLKDKCTCRDRTELIERFRRNIQNYSDAKQLIGHFNGMIKYVLFAFFAWGICDIPSLLVALQCQLRDDDSTMFEIIFLSMMIQWLFVANLTVCEPGERVTSHFDEFCTQFSRCEWNKLPIGMQQVYLVFLSDTQQPKNIRSYGGILCTRDTFKKISTTGFSYFMTLRRFQV